MTGLIKLKNRAVVRVEGEDAVDFLQGIITNTLHHLEYNEACFAGLLTPQGKLLFDFFLVRQDNFFLIELDSFLVDDFLKRLTFYKLRAKVDITHLPEAIVGAVITPTVEGPGGAVVYQDPRLPKAGKRFILVNPATTDVFLLVEDELSWKNHRIRLGLPEGGLDYVYGDCFPHDVAMDQLNGIAFDKGCYVGQEVVSRMRHRGTARKRPMIVVSPSELPTPPVPLSTDNVSIGEIGTISNDLGLAIVRLDRITSERESGKAIYIDGVQVRLCRPDYATYGDEFERFSNTAPLDDGEIKCK